MDNKKENLQNFQQNEDARLQVLNFDQEQVGQQLQISEIELKKESKEDFYQIIQQYPHCIMKVQYKSQFDLIQDQTTNLLYPSAIIELQLRFKKSFSFGQFKQFSLIFPNLINLQKLTLIFTQKGQLDNSTIEDLGYSLRYLQSLSYLKIEIRFSNGIGPDKFTSLLSGLHKLVNLKQLIIHVCQYNFIENGSISLGLALKSLISLRSLEIYIDENDIGSEGAIQIGEGLLKLELLEILVIKIFGNHIQNIGAIGLGVGISNLKNLKTLKINIQDPKKQQNIGWQGLEGITTSIYHLKQLENLKFQFYLVKFQSKAAQSIGKALGNLKNLKFLKLIIRYGSEIGEDGAIDIGQGLQNLKELVEVKIQIYHNNKLFDSGAQSIVGGLKNSQNLKILKLIIQDVSMGSIGGQRMGEELKCLTSLTNFNLQINCCLKQGAIDILRSLQYMNQIKKLQIEFGKNDNIGIEGAIALGCSLKYLNQSLENLYISVDCNFIQDQGLQAIGQSLKTLVNLTKLKLNISLNNLKNEGFIGLFQGISGLINIKKIKLCLNESQIEGQILSLFSQSFAQLQNLQRLQLTIISYEVEDKDFEEFAVNIKNLKQLNSLQLNMLISKITTIPYQLFFKNLSQIQSLTKINIYFQNGRQIPTQKKLEAIYQLKNLVRLISLILLKDDFPFTQKQFNLFILYRKMIHLVD